MKLNNKLLQILSWSVIIFCLHLYLCMLDCKISSGLPGKHEMRISWWREPSIFLRRMKKRLITSGPNGHWKTGQRNICYNMCNTYKHNLSLFTGRINSKTLYNFISLTIKAKIWGKIYGQCIHQSVQPPHWKMCSVRTGTKVKCCSECYIFLHLNTSRVKSTVLTLH